MGVLGVGGVGEESQPFNKSSGQQISLQGNTEIPLPTRVMNAALRSRIFEGSYFFTTVI